MGSLPRTQDTLHSLVNAKHYFVRRARKISIRTQRELSVMHRMHTEKLWHVNNSTGYNDVSIILFIIKSICHMSCLDMRRENLYIKSFSVWGCLCETRTECFIYFATEIVFCLYINIKNIQIFSLLFSLCLIFV